MRPRSLLSLAVWVGAAAAIWPIPSSYVYGSDVLWIDQKVKISYNGASNMTSNNATNKIVTNAIERTYDTLFNKNFVPWKFHPRFTDFEPALTSNSTYITSITLQQNGTDSENIYKRTVETQDDSYTLSVKITGEVVVTAATSIGLLYGLTTFTQIFYKTASGHGVYTPYAPVEVIDAPKFPWRGLNVDCSRTFKPVSDLYAMIDALSYNKMNRLHWHITDSQAWPLEIPAMPDLADKGAYISFQKYSTEDVKAVQEYGALLGVEVVIEIDNPGHTASIAYSYPDLIAAWQIPQWSTYAAEPPSGTLKLNSTAVYDFLEKLFDDLWPRLKPYTSYFHLGGDEVNVQAYLLDDTVRSNLTSVLQPLMQKYMDRNMAQIQSAGLTPLVWEEMLLTWNLTLPNNTIVQTWQSDAAVLETVQKGHYALVGNYEYWYLDCGYGQWLDFYPSSAAAYWPYEDYCSPRHNWRVMYNYDPLAGIPSNLTHLVLGGETHIWSEQTDSINLDTMVWPRTCAAAEVLWSGAKDPVTGQNRSQITAAPRLSEMRERLVARGIRAEPIQMPFCLMNGTTTCAL